MNVYLDQEDINRCLRHASDIVQYYGGEGGLGSGRYLHNKVDSNILGAKCELAFSKLLSIHCKDIPNINIENNFWIFDTYNMNHKPRGDILVSGPGGKELLFEVKGLRHHQWSRFRRMIPPKQLNNYVSENAIVIWETATADVKDFRVRIHGWNYASEVQEFGKYIETICPNIWLEDDNKMRSITELLGLIEEEFPHIKNDVHSREIRRQRKLHNSVAQQSPEENR